MDWQLASDFGTINGFGVDNRAALQDALNSTAALGRGLIIDGQYGLQFDSSHAELVVPSNSNIKFQPGAALKLLPHDLKAYNVFLIDGVSNVVIERPLIDGAKELNADPGTFESEYGMGIGLYDATNVTIIDPDIRNTWGDGIYIGGGAKCQNINIHNPVIGGCRRNGMSIVTVDGLKVWSPLIKRINDTNPKAGIDFEPNNNDCELKNIFIYSPRTVNCNLGIEFYMDNFPGPKPKVVSISVLDFKSINDGDTSLFFGDLQKGTNSVSGTINVHNVRYVKPNIAKGIQNWDNSIVMSVTGETTIS
jgi:hypothetical protein